MFWDMARRVSAGVCVDGAHCWAGLRLSLATLYSASCRLDKTSTAGVQTIQRPERQTPEQSAWCVGPKPVLTFLENSRCPYPPLAVCAAAGAVAGLADRLACCTKYPLLVRSGAFWRGRKVFGWNQMRLKVSKNGLRLFIKR